MRSTVWKFPLKVTDSQRVMVLCGKGRDDGARFLSVQEQNGQLALWAMVDATLKPTPFKVRIVGTGHDVPDVSEMLFVGTVQQMNGALVWHVFIEAED